MARRFFFLLVLPYLASPAVAASAPPEAGVEPYTRLVAADADLVGYWRFEGDVSDAKGLADGQSKPGEPQFVEGPGGGQAVLLGEKRFLTMGPTPHLDVRKTTVELWLKPTFEPGPGYNPCIVAKRAHGSNRGTRFSVHVWGDYSCLAVWNGRTVLRFLAAGGPLRRGAWHHVAVTCDGRTVTMYVDGVPCKLEGSKIRSISTIPACRSRSVRRRPKGRSGWTARSTKSPSTAVPCPKKRSPRTSTPWASGPSV